MHSKKNESKFTIQFSRTDPTHIQVADILNKQERHGKARYIVEAVTHYLSCAGELHSVQINDEHIKTVVSRMLRDWRESGAGILPTSVPAGSVDDIPQSAADRADDIIYNDTVETLGEDGLSAVAEALDMFRKK
jgi:hypothetical protein